MLIHALAATAILLLGLVSEDQLATRRDETGRRPSANAVPICVDVAVRLNTCSSPAVLLID